MYKLLCSKFRTKQHVIFASKHLPSGIGNLRCEKIKRNETQPNSRQEKNEQQKEILNRPPAEPAYLLG